MHEPHGINEKIFLNCSRCFGSCDGRVVKALDLKSNGIFPRRFEPYSQRYFHHRFPVSCPTGTISIVSYLLSCDGRVVKAFDSKSNGIFPRRFESYSQRLLVSHWCHLENFTKTCALSGNRTPVSRVAGENSTTEPTMLVIWGKPHLGIDLSITQYSLKYH